MKSLYLIALITTLGCTNQLIQISRLSSVTEEAPRVSTCDERCLEQCRENFSNSDAYKKCSYLSGRDVDNLKRTINSMKRGSWTSINEGQISLLSDISYEPWVKYSSKSTEGMLEWIAETQWVGDYLDTEILREGLASLSYLSREKGVIDGLKKNISDNQKTTFIELAAWEKNEVVFKKIHKTLSEACDGSKCIRKVYCAQGSDIVIEMINDLDLAEDLSSRDRFHRGLCQ